MKLLAVAAACALVVCCQSAEAQLRIVTYNTTGAPRSGMDVVLRAIGEETRNGIAKPIDVLLLQEQSRSAGLPNTQAFVNLLNSLYVGQGVSYARGSLIGAGDTTQSVVYRTETVELLSEVTVGTTSTSGQPRQTLREKLKPVGYDDTAAFYIYNSHYKASQGTDSGGSVSNAQRRLVEATAIRANADALGEGAHIIYAGDHNFYDYDADEPAFGKLVSAGPGQANDPVNRIGTWHTNSAFADVHTQSPTTVSHFAGQVTGGMDDRFDFQLVSGEFLGGEGLSYIPGSYRALGNNGSTYNAGVDAATNAYTFSGITSNTKAQILSALASVTDHLPVVADYQIPAKMSVQVASIPSTVLAGALVPINVTIANIAPALAAIGADELDYILSVSGDLTGGATGVELALGGGSVQQVFLNTASPGLKSGLITVTSTSQQVTGGSFSLPVNFKVLASLLAADFNEDGRVDGFDLAAWQAGYGLGSSAAKSQGDADADGDVDGQDFLVWQQQTASPPAHPVPEPSALPCVLVALSLLVQFRAQLPNGFSAGRSLPALHERGLPSNLF